MSSKHFRQVFAAVLTQQTSFLFGPQKACKYKSSPKATDVHGWAAITSSWLLFLSDEPSTLQPPDVPENDPRPCPETSSVVGFLWPLRHLTAHAKHPKKPMAQLRFQCSRCECRMQDAVSTCSALNETETSVCIIEFSDVSASNPARNLLDFFAETLTKAVDKLGLQSTSASYMQCLEEETARLEKMRSKVVELSAAQNYLSSSLSCESKRIALANNPEIESLYSVRRNSN